MTTIRNTATMTADELADVIEQEAREMDAARRAERDTTLTLMAPTGHMGAKALAFSLHALALRCAESHPDIATALSTLANAAEKGRTDKPQPVTVAHALSCVEQAIAALAPVPAYVVPLPHGVQVHPASVAAHAERAGVAA